MRARVSLLGLLAGAVLLLDSSPIVASQAGELTVTATYKGKGAVDDTHEISVFLFDHPNPTGQSQPMGMQVINKNGGSTTFKGLSATPVYVIVVYDEKAIYDPTAGPPPTGTPWAAYGKAGKPVLVTPAAGAKAAVVFDDSQRFAGH
jgi:hypothetical protein